jgi:alpha-methylacyl-CoA racemase
VTKRRKGPLSGLAVVEMSGIGPTPLAGQFFADMGAQVTVIDRRSGEDMARDVNRRGKRSIAIDLKQNEGAEIVISLAERADVLIEGYRPGVMERLGLGPDACHARNPRLVYGRMTGWGQHGPLSQTAGHDINYLATTGALAAIGDADRPPPPPLNLIADYGGGAMLLYSGVLAALFEVARSGAGQVVDAAMVDGVPAMLGLLYSWRADGSWVDRRQSNLIDGGAPFYRCYETADGGYMSVGAIEPQFFSQLLGLLHLDPEWNENRGDRGKWPELQALMETRFKSKSREEWTIVFEGSDACVAPVLEWSEVAGYRNNRERNGYLPVGGMVQPAPAPRFSRTPAGTPVPATLTGGERDEVMYELGFEDERISGLVKKGVLT